MLTDNEGTLYIYYYGANLEGWTPSDDEVKYLEYRE